MLHHFLNEELFFFPSLKKRLYIHPSLNFDYKTLLTIFYLFLDLKSKNHFDEKLRISYAQD